MVESKMANKNKTANQEYNHYQDLRVDFDPDQVSWTDGSHQNASEIEKRVVIKNGDHPIKECQVVVEELAYHFGGKWTDPPNGYETKTLRWVEESGVRAEKIEIPANGSAKLAIATLYRYPNPYFGISYADGDHGKTHHFVGAYRLTLRLEAKISGGNAGQTLTPALFEIHLNYVGALDLGIEEILKVSGT
jgi:hypothetical protein